MADQLTLNQLTAEAGYTTCELTRSRFPARMVSTARANLVVNTSGGI